MAGGGGWAGLLLIYFIAPRARKSAQFTIPDLLEARYNQTARVLGVIAILFAYTAITSYQFIGGGDILHLIFPDVSPRIWANTSLPFCHRLHRHRRDGIGRVYGCGDWLAGDGHPAARVALRVACGGRMGRRHPRSATTHFQVLGDFNLAQALELFLPTMLLMLGNQSMYQKIFLGEGERRAQRGGRDGSSVRSYSKLLLLHWRYSGRCSFLPARCIDAPGNHRLYGVAWIAGVAGRAADGAVFAKIVSTANNYLFSPATNLINDVFIRYVAPGPRIGSTYRLPSGGGLARHLGT